MQANNRMETTQRVRPTKGVSRTTSPAQARKWYADEPIFRLCRGRLPQNWAAPLRNSVVLGSRLAALAFYYAYFQEIVQFFT